MIDESLRGPFFGLDLPAVRELIDRDGVRAVAERTLDAIERLNPQLNAFVHLDRARTLADADRLDALPPDGRGPLHGVPVASEALLPLDLGPGRWPGLLLMGSADATRFTPAQGTDLLRFFGQAFRLVLLGWLRE